MAPTTVTTVPATTTSVAGGSAGSTVPAPTTAPPVTAAPTTTAPVGGTRTLSAEGGTATVQWSATSLTVVRTAPAAGWTLEQVEQRSATRVVVKFRRDGGGSGSSSSTIDARVVGGALEWSS